MGALMEDNLEVRTIREVWDQWKRYDDKALVEYVLPVVRDYAQMAHERDEYLWFFFKFWEKKIKEYMAARA